MARDLGVKFNATPTQSSAPMKGTEGFQQSTSTLMRSQKAADALKMRTLQADEAQAKQASEIANAPSTIAKETVKGTAGQLFGGPIKAARSAVDFIGQKITGKKPEGTFIGVTGEPEMTYQGELEAGKSPLAVAGGATLDVASALPAGKIVGKGGSMLKSVAPRVAEEISKGASALGKMTGISGYLAKRAEKKAADTALKAITPSTKDLTPTEYEELLSRKRITPKTTKTPSTYVLSESEKNVASKYKNLLNTGDPVKNSTNLVDAISKKDEEVGNFLRENNAIFNTGELKNSILEKLKDVSDVSIPESRVNKLKQSMVENFVKTLDKNDMESLWQARKAFDQDIERAFSGSPTLQNKMKKEFRNAVQDFIAEGTPEEVYKTSMKEMRDLFNILETVNTKATKEKGLNALQVWLKENPTKAKIFGGLVGTGVVGSAIID